MVTVISPRLCSSGVSLCTKYGTYFCLDELRNFVEIPEAKYYWVEASDRQFKERNGCMVKIEGYCDNASYKGSDVSGELECILDKYLCELGLKDDDVPIKIWFRLLYEVE